MKARYAEAAKEVVLLKKLTAAFPVEYGTDRAAEGIPERLGVDLDTYNAFAKNIRAALKVREADRAAVANEAINAKNIEVLKLSMAREFNYSALDFRHPLNATGIDEKLVAVVAANIGNGFEATIAAVKSVI